MNVLAYRLLIIVLSPVLLAHIIWLAVKNKHSRYFCQRLGFNYSALPRHGLWFHCASVGEVITLLPLVKILHEKDKQLKIIITTNTITGGKIVSQQNLDYLFHSYLPFDWSHSVKRFLSTVQPYALYVMETEIWPNLFRLCQRKNIPVRLINARLSSRTTSANRWVKSLLKTSLDKTDAIYARTEKDAAAYAQLTGSNNRIQTIGNLKFTTAIRQNQASSDSMPVINRPYVLFASTHQDEEKQVYDIWKKLQRDELLVIAPRHPERRTTIINQLDCKDIAVRSQHHDICEQTKIFLLDTVGELTALFNNANFVIMGGSFVPVGGHNILEPASYNKAIITGPYMENFKDELKLMLENKAIIQIAAGGQVYEELGNQILRLLDDRDYRADLEKNTASLKHNVENILKDYSELILSEKEKEHQ